MKVERYVIIDSRSHVGNSVLFWAWDGQGYTVDLRCAGIYTEDEANKICASRDTDKMVRYADLLPLVQHHIDTQDLRKWQPKTDQKVSHVFSHLLVSKKQESAP